MSTFQNVMDLQEMQDFWAWRYVGMVGWLIQMENVYLHPAPENSDGPAQSPLAEESLKRLYSETEQMQGILKECEFKNSIWIAERLKIAIGNPPHPKRAATLNYADGICHLIGELRQVLTREMQERRFFMVSPETLDLIDGRIVIFGEVIRRAFPSCIKDAEDAINCMICDNHTAVVFHCMRVLEHGLRALATDVGQSFGTEQWHTVIEGIQSKIKSIERSLPKGDEKLDRMAHLSEAAKEFSYFKDAWRNHVTHTRGVYDYHQARSILNHTDAFMNSLSRQVCE